MKGYIKGDFIRDRIALAGLFTGFSPANLIGAINTRLGGSFKARLPTFRICRQSCWGKVVFPKPLSYPFSVFLGPVGGIVARSRRD
ncbi:hypothetical protein [Cohaesibacter haloalkalitolerans]|uniref:hypothetical protein n=1 Tax=Cohaesibacter haloalkalitolerans TaxID=1162980 RepID=UPI000E657305|nr:hypothetical protein [Cohaesibacter haloalkalitolerans]